MSDARTTSRAAPVVQTGPVQWAKENLFNGPVNTALTLISLYVLWLAIPPLVNWALIDAVFTPDPATCKAASGACWGFITEKYRLMLSGTYPYEQQWRPVVAMVVLLGLIGMSMNSRFWNIWLAAYWVVGIVVMGVPTSWAIPAVIVESAASCSAWRARSSASRSRPRSLTMPVKTRSCRTKPSLTAR